jgi:hypothetical protein
MVTDGFWTSKNRGNLSPEPQREGHKKRNIFLFPPEKKSAWLIKLLVTHAECFVTRSSAVENGIHPAGPANLESRQDPHTWHGDPALEDVETQQAGRPDHGPDPMSEETMIAGVGI